MPRCNTPICHNCNRTLTSVYRVVENHDYCESCHSDLFVTCAGCSNVFDNDICILHDGSFYCPTCFYDRWFHCRRCGTRCNRRISDLNEYSNTYCYHCFDYLFVRCIECSELVHRSVTYNNPEGESLCQGCFNSYCFTCDDCGQTIWQSDMHRANGGRYCRRCEPYHVARDWPTGEFSIPTPSYGEIGSERKFGVELETYRCPEHHTLKDKTIWGCVPDCSIEGLEFVSPILYGDEGLNEIKTFCHTVEDMDWSCNSSCGFHAHFDVTNENWESLRSIAYAYRKTYALWCAFVSESRTHNTMCGAPEYSLSDIRKIKSQSDWEYFVGQRDRFEYINWRAYFVHGTMEVRSHDATLDGGLICSWIMAHARFIDSVRNLSLSAIDELFGSNVNEYLDGFTTCVGSELAEFYSNLAGDYGKPFYRNHDTMVLPAPF